ncbi:MAG: hypothetical protein JST40_01910 [Armatimonadetes bacterium]|nr:hypothetical protein [Armatimonadota bacterium]
MLTAAILSTILCAPAPTDLAIAARFYKAGKAKSKFEICLIKSDGSGLRVLPTTGDVGSVRWVGKDRLAWIKYGDKGSTLWTSRLSPWKPVQIAKGNSIGTEDSYERTAPPGVAAFRIDDRIVIVDPQSGKTQDWLMGRRESSFPLEESGTHEFKGATYAFNDDGDYGATSIQGEGWTLEGNRMRARPSANEVTFYDWDHNSTSGSIQTVWVWDGKAKPKIILECVNSFDYWPGRDIVAATSPRETSSLGKLEVWTSTLSVGYISHPPAKVILKGLVWVANVAVRP